MGYLIIGVVTLLALPTASVLLFMFGLGSVVNAVSKFEVESEEE